MKKLNLDDFNKYEVLTRAQLKELIGGNLGSGFGGGGYFCQCANGTTVVVTDAPTEQAAREVANSVCRPYVVYCHPN